MRPEEKDLLLKDLCARLPYRVKGKCEIDASYDTSFDTIFQLHKFDAILEGIKEDLLFVTPLIEDKNEQEFANEEVADGIDVLDFKPYLRPLSSMTEEEHNEWFNYYHEIELKEAKSTGDYLKAAILGESASIDWLNKKMFDFRGLIPKDLALIAKVFNPYVED